MFDRIERMFDENTTFTPGFTPPGRLSFPIPRLFKVGNRTEAKVIDVLQVHELHRNGDRTTSKGGTSVTAKYEDPTTNY